MLNLENNQDIRSDKTVFLHELGCFYEIYWLPQNNKKYNKIADVLNLIKTCRNKNKKIGIYFLTFKEYVLDNVFFRTNKIVNPHMMGFPKSSGDKFIKKLYKYGYKVNMVTYDRENNNTY